MDQNEPNLEADTVNSDPNIEECRFVEAGTVISDGFDDSLIPSSRKDSPASENPAGPTAVAADATGNAMLP